MDYVYYLANTSLTLRISEYLRIASDFPLAFMTVVHQIDGWVVRIKMSKPLTPLQDGNLQAFLNELGTVYEPSLRVKMALRALELGQPPIEVMHHYQVAIVAHGKPDLQEIEAFRQQFVIGLGYCPETLV
jgi:hypothetical protein